MIFSSKINFCTHFASRYIVAGVLLSTPLVILLMTSWLIAGRVIYSLDDPYIHLALAKQIANGHYGINPGSYSAPSSSLLWPFLLTPWAWLGDYFDAVPLIINWGCTVAIGLVIWSFLKSIHPWGIATLQTALIMFSLNIWGVAFTGMEHSLQLLMTAVIGSSLIKERYSWHFWLSITLLPWVRYEGLAITLPTLTWIAWQFSQGTSASNDSKKNLSAVAFSLLISLGGLAIFSFWLHSVNLGWMPSSIMAKTGGLFDSTPDLEILEGAITNAHHQSFHLTSQLLLVLTSINACLAFYQKKWSWGSLIVILPAILHMVFGQFGWFGRYENYALLYQVIITFGTTQWLNQITKALLLGIIFIMASPLWVCTQLTPGAMKNIWEQQWQMSLIARELNAPIAVNDLGLVALHSQKHVLDLWGLGSIEALNARKSMAPNDLWIEALMTRHQTEFAFVYDSWFHHLPAGWIPVAQMVLQSPPVSVGGTRVTLYATNKKAAQKLLSTIMRYSEKNSTQARSLLINPALITSQ